MEPVILKNKRKSRRVPAELTVLGQPDGRSVGMLSANISMDGLFLFSREFVRPHAIFAAKIWLDNEEEALSAYMTSCFIESTWSGFGIGAQISGMSSDDGARWESFYRSRAADHPEPSLATADPDGDVQSGNVLVVGGAMHSHAIQALRERGLQVWYASSVDEALPMLQRHRIDAVISDLRSSGLDGLALCCYIKASRLPTRIILLTNSSMPKDFLLGLYAGAMRVVSKPCSNELLVSRVLAVLQLPAPAGTAWPSDDLAYRRTDEAMAPLSAGENVEVVPATDKPSRRVARRVTQSIGLAVRYVSDRLMRRQVA